MNNNKVKYYGLYLDTIYKRKLIYINKDKCKILEFINNLIETNQIYCYMYLDYQNNNFISKNDPNEPYNIFYAELQPLNIKLNLLEQHNLVQTKNLKTEYYISKYVIIFNDIVLNPNFMSIFNDYKIDNKYKICFNYYNFLYSNVFKTRKELRNFIKYKYNSLNLFGTRKYHKKKKLINAYLQK